MNLDFFEQFPVLQTTRLVLRALVDEDAGCLFEVFRDEQVTRYYDIPSMTDEAEAVRLIALLSRRFAHREGVRWAITQKPSAGEACASQRLPLIGTIGFNSLSLQAHKASLGYELAQPYWNRGLATEAIRAVVDFGHGCIGLNRIEATVMLENERSMRALNKVGFQQEGVLRAYGFWKGSYHDLAMFSILQPHADTPS